MHPPPEPEREQALLLRESALPVLPELPLSAWLPEQVRVPVSHPPQEQVPVSLQRAPPERAQAPVPPELRPEVSLQAR